MTTTFCTSGAALLKAGFNRSTSANVDTGVEDWINEAESYINVATRYNWTDVYATLNDDVRKILQETASALAAIDVIIYDMGDYNSRAESEDMINVLNAIATRNIAVLKDKEFQSFLKDPSTGSV